MPFGLPARDEANWDTKLNDSINAVKATADAAQPAATLDASVTAVDANAASALRVQQDARLSATNVTRAAQVAHAPGLGLFFVEAEGGGPSATAAANTAAFEAARLAAAAAQPGGGVVTDADAHPTITRGGGTVWLQAGATYNVDGPITINPRTKLVGYGATIVGTTAAAGLYAPPSGVSGSFMSDYPALEGVTFDGNNIATHGLRLEGTAHASVRDVLVLRCASHNIRLTGAQWSHFANVSSQMAGGYDWYLEPYDPGATRLPNCNNNRFVDCFAQRGTLGGVYIDGGQGNDFFGFTSQFHPTTAGVTIAGGAIGMSFFGGHFENNLHHFDIVQATNTRIVSPYFNSSTGVERFVRNGATAQDTVVVSPSCNRSAISATGAHYERVSGGELTVIRPPRVSGVTSFVDGTGAVTDPSLGRLTSPASLKVLEDDYRQNGNTLYGRYVFAGENSSVVNTKWKYDTDADFRFNINTTGTMVWGDGTGASDVNMYRAAAGVMAMTGNFRPVGNTQTLGVSSLGWQKIFFGTGGVHISQGTGSPEGVVFAQAGSIFLRNDGSFGTTLYVKESGSAGTNTGWVAFASRLSATATLDFPSVAAAGSQELTITVTGAAVGNAVHLGPPAAIEAGLVWNGYVSAADTVKIRVSNITAAAIDPASATWRATVVR